MTLIELMVVVAIIAILASVAVGIYHSYIKTSYEVDPVSVLLTASSAMEEYYADHGRYASTIEELSGFNDTNADNKVVFYQDKDPRRRFYICVATNCEGNSVNPTCSPNNSTDSYCLLVSNEASDERWKIEWYLYCSANSPVGSCKPKQIKGAGLLRGVF